MSNQIFFLSDRVRGKGLYIPGQEVCDLNKKNKKKLIKILKEELK